MNHTTLTVANSGTWIHSQICDTGYVQIGSSSLAHLVGPWRDGPGPAHQRLSDVLRLLVLDGRLPLGCAVPSERDLAGSLRTSRTTVTAAYRTLAEQGYLATAARRRAAVRLPHDDSDLGRAANATSRAADTLDLSIAAPAAPTAVLHAAYAIALERLPGHFHRNGYDRNGVPALRDAVAGYYRRRGLPTTSAQILITNGAQHAIGLLARVLVRPRDVVVIDHPTYPHAIKTFSESGARINPVALHPTRGWDATALRSAAAGAKLAYLLPDFHNPTGLYMSDEVRARAGLGCLTVIDETMADLAVEPTHADARPFAAHHRTAITIGSVSKSIWPGLRVGWIRADPALLQRINRARPAVDLGTPVVEQLAVAELLETGAERNATVVSALANQRDTAARALRQHLPDVAASIPDGGLTIWARLPSPIAARLAMTAPDHGVTIAAGPRFGVGGAFARHIRIPYSLPPDELAEAIRRLATARQALEHGARGRHRQAPLA